MEEKREDEPKAYYLSRSYQMHIKDKYNIYNSSLLYDDKLCLMLYASEWFKIPKNMYYMQIKLHPYLTIRDDNLASELNNKYKRSLVFFFLANFALMNIIGSNSKRTKVKLALRLITTLACSGITTTLFNSFYLHPLFEESLKMDKHLNKYFTLDLNQNLIKSDLTNYGIIIR